MFVNRRLIGGRRGLAALVTAVTLVLAGVTCIGVAVARQAESPQQPPSVQETGPVNRSIVAATTTNKAVGPVLPASAPTALNIPAIGVHSPLLRLGLTAKGAMEVPTLGPNYNKAGWYRNSPAPGSIGPAIIVGHVDSAATGPSVFFRLGKLRPQDTVLITRADGSVAVFAVDEIHSYRKSRFPTQLVYGNTNRATLRLITCGGQFDHANGHYLDNIVVFASLVSGSGGSLPALEPHTG